MEKMTELKQQGKEKEKRINQLTDKIITLKNEQLHLRCIIFQFIKSFGIKLKEMDRYRRNTVKVFMGEQSLIIMEIILQLMEYSEDERD